MFTPEAQMAWIPDRVEKGIAELTAKDADWFLGIDVEALNQADDALCVLGQLEGEYPSIRGRDQKLGKKSVSNGYHAPRMSFDDQMEYYDRSTDCWGQRIYDLQAAAA